MHKKVIVTALSTLATGSVQSAWSSTAEAMNPTSTASCGGVAERLNSHMPVRYRFQSPEDWDPQSKIQTIARIEQWNRLPGTQVPWKDATGYPFVKFEEVDTGPEEVAIFLDEALGHGRGWTACDQSGILHVNFARADAIDSFWAPYAAGAAAHEFGHVCSLGGVGFNDHTSALNSNSGLVTSPPLLSTCINTNNSTVSNDDRSFEQYCDVHAPFRAVTHNAGFENGFDGWKAPGAAQFALQVSGNYGGNAHAAWLPSAQNQVLVPIHAVNVSWRQQNSDDYPGFEAVGAFRNSSPATVTIQLMTYARGVRWGAPSTFSGSCGEIDPNTGQLTGSLQFPDGQNHNLRESTTPWFTESEDVEVGGEWGFHTSGVRIPDVVCDPGAGYALCDWQGFDTNLDVRFMSPPSEPLHIDNLELQVHECPPCLT